jgi:hypothetical protein
MSKDKARINTGGGAYIGGNLNTEGGKFVGRDDFSHTGIEDKTITRLFEVIYSTIESHSKLTKQEKIDIREDVNEIKQEFAKEEINEGFLLRRLRNIGRMAPDILEVTLATMVNPAAGFGLIGVKIAEKIKQESK